MFDSNQPYNDLPLLPPETELETKAILKEAIAASRAVADLRGKAQQIPNQRMMIDSIVLQEARMSSEIENIVTTNDELYRAAADMDGLFDSHTKEVLRYRQAIWHGYEQIKKRPLTVNLFVEIVRIIKQIDLDVRKTTGTKLSGPSGEIVYTPPEGEQIIRQKLANLESFIYGEDDLDPLVKLAVMHYQFEAIHPFADGNGRTGRILNILFLVEKGLLDMPVLFLSRYILENKGDYYDGLRKVTEEHRWEEWIMYILKGIEITAKQTSAQIDAILNLMESVKDEMREKAEKIYSKELLEMIFMHPYCKIKFLEQAGIAKRQTASNYLQTLSDIGVLRAEKIGRENYYINDPLLNILMGR
ncbi:MAG: Fic family protein [Sulfurovum sp.]|nr:Fic family protein [Sulfurovum sp.]MDD3602627.1 Fic family protein [Sulfurovum sp.]